MKKVFIILVISCLCLFSCSIFKKRDKCNDFKDNIQLKELVMDSIYEIPIDDEFIVRSSPRVIEKEVSPIVKQNPNYITKEAIGIKNKIDTVLVKDDNIGIIGYNIPNTFEVEKYSTIKLRISKKHDVEEIINGNRGITIVGNQVNDDVILESLEVSDTMSAKLYSDTTNTIVELVSSGSEQRLYDTGYTEWIWRVKPLSNKSTYLKLIITITDRDLVVYEETIPVQGNMWYSIEKWISKWWELLATTLIIPILIPIFIYYRKKKKKSSK